MYLHVSLRNLALMRNAYECNVQELLFILKTILHYYFNIIKPFWGQISTVVKCLVMMRTWI